MEKIRIFRFCRSWGWFREIRLLFLVTLLYPIAFCQPLHFGNSGDFDSREFYETQVLSCLLKGAYCNPNRADHPSEKNGGLKPALSYTVSSYTFLQNFPIVAITPVVSGLVTSCSSNPSLPSGVSIDNTTCVISGTPTGTQSATTHIITAANDHGSGQTAISITVTVPLQPLVQYDFTNGSLVNSGSVVISLGSPEASPVLTVGKDGDANGGYLYNANNQYFSAADTGLPMGASQRTICAWVNPSVLPANGFHHMVIRYGNTTGANASVLAISTQASAPKISFIGSAYDAHADYTMPTNTWSHLCSTFNGGTTASLYVNGVFIASPTFVGTGPLNTISSSLAIGTWTGSGGTAYYWRGVLDDVRIYGVALSDAQIGRIYSIGATY